jgi:4-amino-4-deoxy-L-arabinose transferase-like glycosyltransferase
MKISRRLGGSDFLIFVLILIAAAGTRVWYLRTCCGQGANEGPYQVQDDWQAERDDLLDNLRKGTFSAKAPLATSQETTAHTAYLYPWLLASLDRATKTNDWAVTFQRMRWIQAVLGGLTAALYYLVARLAFRSRLVGLLAGLFGAVYPFWVFNTAEINDGVVTTFLLALALFLGVRAGHTGGALTSLLYGLTLAALASIRAALLPFSLVAVLWFLWRSRRLPSGWMLALLSVLGLFIGLAPWVMRNFQTFGEITPMVNSAYLHLWQGNNSRSTGGPQNDAAMRDALAERGDYKPEDLAKMSQSERYRLLAWQVRDEIRANPEKTFERRLLAGLSFFFGERWLSHREYCHIDTRAKADVPPVKEVPPEEKRLQWLDGLSGALLAGSLLTVLTLGALGWRWSYGWRREAMPTSLAVIWIFLPYFLSHAEAWHGPRLPLDGVFICYVAFAVACLLPPTARHLLAGEEVDPF